MLVLFFLTYQCWSKMEIFSFSGIQAGDISQCENHLKVTTSFQARIIARGFLFIH